MCSGSGASRKFADRRREVEADDRADGDGQDRAEEPRPQLAEVVDERHDRVVGRARVGPGGVGAVPGVAGMRR